jgi:hypothetical protein
MTSSTVATSCSGRQGIGKSRSHPAVAATSRSRLAPESRHQDDRRCPDACFPLEAPTECKAVAGAEPWRDCDDDGRSVLNRQPESFVGVIGLERGKPTDLQILRVHPPLVGRWVNE